MTTVSAFDAILSSLRDIIKFEITKHVNTGDKTLDNLLNTFLLSFMTMVFAILSYNSLLMKYYLWKHKKSSVINSKTVEYYTTLLKETPQNEFTYVTWYTNSGEPSAMIFIPANGDIWQQYKSFY